MKNFVKKVFEDNGVNVYVDKQDMWVDISRN